MRKTTARVAYVLMLWLMLEASQHPAGQLRVVLTHRVGERPLQPDSTYQNALGQSFRVTKFRYYLGQIQLLTASGDRVACGDYALIDEDEPESKIINLTGVPSGTYTGMTFRVGVDSARNCSGVQEGALDPLNGMFWTWNTGYIFMKLEGRADASSAPGHLLEYHVGGFRAPANCIREVRLTFPQELVVGGNSTPTVGIVADLLALLSTPHAIDFSTLPTVTDFHHAETLADNYANMFRLNDLKP